ncbi:hypothetical protein MYBA111488_21610 [Mycobacterium basiliense]
MIPPFRQPAATGLRIAARETLNPDLDVRIGGVRHVIPPSPAPAR